VVNLSGVKRAIVGHDLISSDLRHETGRGRLVSWAFVSRYKS